MEDVANGTRILRSPIGARARIDGREVDYFCGTSYFGLHGHPEVVAAACEATRSYGIGSATALRTPIHDELDGLLRRFFGVDEVSYVASGYLAPLVLLQALRDDFELAFADSACHYGVVDALRSVGKEVITFRHLDVDDLSRQLARRLRPRQRPLVITDGVFPSSGALAPLPDIAATLEGYASSLLCVDDAHAVGVLGTNGRGTPEHFAIPLAGIYACGTLSKAFGGAGGIVPGDGALAAKVRDRSRVPIGASAPSVPIAAAAAAGVRILAEHPEMRQALWSNVRRVRDGVRALGFDIQSSPVPIVHLAGRPGLDLRRAHAKLDREDLVVLYVPPRGYSDAPDVESLRIAVFSTHTREQIDRLLDALGRAL